MSLSNFNILDGYEADGYSFKTPWIDIRMYNSISISSQFTGSPDGYLSLDCSNESDVGSPSGFITPATPPGLSHIGTVNVLGPQPQFNGLDATTITGPPTTLTQIVTSGVTTFSIILPGYRWVRLVYASSSGSYSITSWFNGK